MQRVNPYLDPNGRPTQRGRRWLERAVTDTVGPVYAIRPALPPVISGAAMARLSRTTADMREMMLAEFAPDIPLRSMPKPSEAEAASALIDRVVTGFGDDSVAQLCNLHLVVENCSILASKLLELGRLGAYLERSTRYVFFDQRDAQERYRFYRPTELDGNWSGRYEQTLNSVMELYSGAVRALTSKLRSANPQGGDIDRAAWMAATRATACDACRVMLPTSVQTTVGMNMSAQAVESLIIHLFSETGAEANGLGLALLREARKVMPAFFKRADLPDRGLATAAYRAAQREKLREWAIQVGRQGQGALFAENDEVVLLRAWGCESDVAASSVFPFFPGGFTELCDRLDCSGLPTEILQAATEGRLNRRHRPPRGYELYHVLWQLLTDFGIFRDLQRHRLVDGLARQPIDPELGYAVPTLIDEHGLRSEFDRAFELSYELHGGLRRAGYGDLAEYACLLGHRLRYILAVNAREMYHIGELRTQKGCHPNYVRVVLDMLRQFEQLAPSLRAGMTFVGEGDTESLTRLAALQGRALAARQLGLTLPDDE